LSEIGLFHHPPVLHREGWSIVRDRTFSLTPLSSTERGGPLSEKGFLASSSEEDPLIQGGTVYETSHSLFVLFYHRRPGSKVRCRDVSLAQGFPSTTNGLEDGKRSLQRGGWYKKMGNHNSSRRIRYCQSTALGRSTFLAFPAIVPMCFGDQWDFSRENGGTIVLVSSVDRFASV
jgi:hypothetical protein